MAVYIRFNVTVNAATIAVMADPMTSFGDHLRALRKDRGLSQEQLGERANIHPKYLGEVERGTGNPSFEILTRLAGALEVDLATLVGDELQRMAVEDVRADVHRMVDGLAPDALRNVARMLRLARR